jgi:hypothetical protein
MDKWRLRLDLTHQIGLGTTFHGVLTVGGDGFGQGESCWSRNLAGRLLNVFPFSPRTNGHSVKQRPLLDLAPQIGLEIPFHRVSDPSSGLSNGGEDADSGILQIGKLGTFCIVAPQP